MYVAKLIKHPQKWMDAVTADGAYGRWTHGLARKPSEVKQLIAEVAANSQRAEAGHHRLRRQQWRTRNISYSIAPADGIAGLCSEQADARSFKPEVTRLLVAR